LFEEEVLPVCSPKLLEGHHPLRTPEDLRHHTLLHVSWGVREETWPGWRMWLATAGVDGVDGTRGPEFSMETMAIQTAIDGHGVALVSGRLVADDLAARRLVKPFALSIPVNYCYFVVAPAATADRPKIAAFREWILAKAREESLPGSS
jgi:LysR family glycine cleavage system transcriptional activator